MRKEETEMADEKKDITLTQSETEAAGFPCSDSAGSEAPDVAPVEVIEDGK